MEAADAELVAIEAKIYYGIKSCQKESKNILTINSDSQTTIMHAI